MDALQSSWIAAQARLDEIRARRDTNAPSERTIRVGQLDAELLDQELVQLLQDPIVKALNSPRWTPELLCLSRLCSTSFRSGIRVQHMEPSCKICGTRSLEHQVFWLVPSGIPRRTLLVHAFLTVGIPYLHNRLRAHALSRAWPDAPSSDRRRKIWDALVSLESAHALAALLSFIAFLWDGRFRTLTDRLLKMRLTPSRRLIKRDVSYEFMNRQMVWHAFTEFLLFLLPLINARTVRRRLTRLKSALTPSFLRDPDVKSRNATRGKYWSLPQDQCAICAENASFNLNLAEPANALTALTASTTTEEDGGPPLYPINTPYIASCGDVFCYSCIAERMMRAADSDDAEGRKWECLRCAQPVESADRLTVESMGTGTGSELSRSPSGSDYEFSSSAGDITDLSSSMVSMGSYSESALSES
ncbi:hypothetical protein HMN09_01218900 [Mycena chlorophos]|uniref:RING-type E3 ubiquitin transferase (cysteine targeting) n=1 Tax=Mycena chlorophos TaxID=658473 RepID=A0A8H6VSL4_MYCCL|nr:hypothetical protein HMN09_01218900 [Mycena chlorophos]